MQKYQIFTHDGIFHADDIFAIALIKVFLNCHDVVRTRDISQKILDYPLRLVIDVGLNYNPELGNFDHHQDPNLESSNVLVLNWLHNQKIISEELYQMLLPDFLEISQIDRFGYITPENKQKFHVNKLIRSLNNMTFGWEQALGVATSYIRSVCEKYDNLLIARENWKNSPDITDKIKYVNCGKYPIDWQIWSDAEVLIFSENLKYKVIGKTNLVFDNFKKFKINDIMAIVEDFSDAVILAKQSIQTT